MRVDDEPSLGEVSWTRIVVRMRRVWWIFLFIFAVRNGCFFCVFSVPFFPFFFPCFPSFPFFLFFPFFSFISFISFISFFPFLSYFFFFYNHIIPLLPFLLPSILLPFSPDPHTIIQTLICHVPQSDMIQISVCVSGQ